jgi:Ca-activated chloride channel family protein
MSRSLPLLDEDDLARLEDRLGAPDGASGGFGALQTERGALPLAALDVRARIDGLLARTELTQTFVNVTDVPLEATYIFPMPDRAAVTGFRMEVAGRSIEARLEERGKARASYDKAIASGQRAAIAEEERPEVFTLRVGNLMPGESAVVRFSLAGVLPYADGEATYRFPLVVAPRYIPGVPLPGPSVGVGTADDTDAVPDASRITPPVLLPGFPSPVRLSIEVVLDGGPAAIEAVRSSLHAVWEDGDGDARLVRVQPGSKLDRDFLLRYRLGGASVRSSLSVHPDADGASAGTFALTLLPAADVPEASPRPRAVAFVLDRSGSMGGWKMAAARRAVAHMVETLTADDTFGVLAFDTAIESPWAGSFGLRRADDRARSHAARWLGKVESRGGTEMAPALEIAAQALVHPEHAQGRDRLLVLVTDGQVGNEHEVLRRLKGPLHGVRVLAVGIDQAVNAGLLQRLADLGGGACELVESESRLDERLEAIHRRMGPPLLSSVRLDFAESGLEVETDSVVPSRAPDLFPGAPLVVLGRYRDTARGPLLVRASDARGAAWAEPVQPAARDNPAIAACWARLRLRALEDQYAACDSSADLERLERAIVAASLRFGVLCRFTAYVAIDRAEMVNAGGEVLRITQPVELPSGWGAEPLSAAAGAAPIGYKSLGMPAARLRAGGPLGMFRRLTGRRPEAAGGGEVEYVDSMLQEFVVSEDADRSDDVLTRSAPLYLSPEQAAAAPELPNRFAHARKVAEGGLGTIYRATDARFGDVLVTTYADRPDLTARFEAEARRLQGLSHPGLVPILEVFTGGGQLFVVRPAAGTPLSRWLAQHGLADPATAAHIVAEAAEVLAAAHAQGLVHGQLGPDDVLIGHDGHARIAGLGREPTGGALGVASYIPPEELLGAAPTLAGDIYRLGILLYHLLTGRLPYGAGGFPGMLERLREGQFDAPRAVNPDIPEALEAICLKAMGFDPSQRFAAAAELAAALRQFLAEAQPKRRKWFWK